MRTCLFWHCLNLTLLIIPLCLPNIRAGEDNALEELVKDFEKETRKPADLSNLRTARLTFVTQWSGVQPAQKKDGDWSWKETDGFASPLGPKAISALVDVPADGEYRVFLRQILEPDALHPVTLTIQLGEGAPQTHVFGKLRLSRGATGKEVEESTTLRFEDEASRLTAPSKPLAAWEYWDVKLAKGVHRLSLASEDQKARVQAVFLSMSKDFRPSLSADPGSNTLRRLFVRFRLAECTPPVKESVLHASLTYHWGRGVRGAKEPLWGWDLGSTRPAAPKTWSAFLDISDGVINGSGPWSTCRMSFSNVKSGSAELQFAWQPFEAAVCHTLTVPIASEQTMLRMPQGAGFAKPSADQPIASVWDPARFSGIITEEQLVKNYLSWGAEALEKLKRPANHPLPKNIRIYSGCGVSGQYRESMAEMLARIGVNWMDNPPPSAAQKYGLINETSLWHINVGKAAAAGAAMTPEARAKVTKIKIADEIGTCMDPELLNADAALLAAFREYLGAQAQTEGQKPEEFFGAKLDELKCLGRLADAPAVPTQNRPARVAAAPEPEQGGLEAEETQPRMRGVVTTQSGGTTAGNGAKATLARRRLFYHSQRFCHLAVARQNAAHMKELLALFPNAHAYNNYSPHPPMFGGTMNTTDWFIVARNAGQNLGWGEDWATGGSWGMGTFQSVSYYGALVDCSTRKGGYPSGFYVCVNCGNAARKMFSCVAQGITWLHLYDWGPIDNWADGSNAWSEHRGEYYNVAVAAHALGPADELIAKGQREPRQTAILYNRSHEIVSGTEGHFIHDCMWTFVALKNAHYPVDIILEEDLTPEQLARYKVLYVWGFNIERRHLSVLRGWVEAGGTLVGSACFGTRDVYGEPLDDTVALFGASQKLNPSDGKAHPKAQFGLSDITTATEITTAGLTAALTPTTGKSVASFDGGSCAAVAGTLGKGKTLLLGLQPGLSFQASGKALSPAREWLVAPVAKALGHPRAELSYHASEVTLFEHPSGLAVLLADFGDGKQPKEGSVLSVEPRREIKSVLSTLHGPLSFEKVGERLEIKVPFLDPVDVIILR
ncbi:MAG TPA: hypothetical protein VGP72_13195 [Planctomycetota bacterium]|jgi:hypothetical protein